MTVPKAEVPPARADGAMLKLLRATGAMVKAAVIDVLPSVALIVAGVVPLTEVTEMLNRAVVAPPATVTLGGTEIKGLLVVKLTSVPPAGAGEPSVTVPVVVNPPTVFAGETEIPCSQPAMKYGLAETTNAPVCVP